MIKRFFKRPGRFAAVFSMLLAAAFVYTLLDAFVIPRTLAQVATGPAAYKTSYPTLSDSLEASVSSAVSSVSSLFGASSAGGAAASSVAKGAAAASSAANTAVSSASGATGVPASALGTAVTSTSYSDKSIAITITTVRLNDTTAYVADIRISAIGLLKTAFAKNKVGNNITETTSAMAADHNAIFAINGDYYGFRKTGYVIRNGKLYRNTASSGEALVVDASGEFSVVTESETTAQKLLDSGAYQVFSFGPGLVENGKITVDATTEVAQSRTSNPRTAIGQIGALHYLAVVSDGRTSESAGLSLLELAQLMQSYGCTNAYNLDGGGSSTMVLNGKIINIPTDGQKLGEREVSDIVYIGYDD